MFAPDKTERIPVTPGTFFDTLLGEERARLVRLCAYLTGNPDVAEDLVDDH